MKHSDKFVLLYPVGSLISSMMDSTDVKPYLCKTMHIMKGTTKCAFKSGLRLHLNAFSFMLSGVLSICCLFLSYCPLTAVRI